MPVDREEDTPDLACCGEKNSHATLRKLYVEGPEAVPRQSQGMHRQQGVIRGAMVANYLNRR